MQNNNIWIINHYANSPLDSTTGGMRHYEFAKQLKLLGWSCTIISASTVHRTDAQRINTKASYSDSVQKGIHFRWIKARSYSGNSRDRILNMLDFAGRILRPYNLRNLDRPSIIWASSPHPFAGLSAYWLSRRYGVPFVYEIRDLWPQTFVDMGALKANSLQAKLLYRIEKFLCDSSDSVITLLPNINLYFQEHGIKPKEVLWIPNSLPKEKEISTNSDLRPSQLFFQYAGSFGEANDVTKLVIAFINFYKSGNTTYKFRLFGNGPLKQEIEQLISASGLPVGTVVLHDSIPKKELAQILQSGFCNLILIKDLDIYKYGVSLNKLLDYYASGVPILQFGNPVNNDVSNHEAGFSVLSTDTEDIELAFDKFVRSGDKLRNKWISNAHKLLDHNFNLVTNSSKLSNTLQYLLDSNSQ